MTATAELKSVDGGGDQRQEAAGDEETIRRLPMAERAIAWAKGFGEISKKFPFGIYSPTLSV